MQPAPASGSSPHQPMQSQRQLRDGTVGNALQADATPERLAEVPTHFAGASRLQQQMLKLQQEQEMLLSKSMSRQVPDVFQHVLGVCSSLLLQEEVEAPSCL